MEEGVDDGMEENLGGGGDDAGLLRELRAIKLELRRRAVDPWSVEVTDVLLASLRCNALLRLVLDPGATWYTVKYVVKQAKESSALWSRALAAMEQSHMVARARERARPPDPNITPADAAARRGFRALMAAVRGATSLVTVGAPFAAHFLRLGAKVRGGMCSCGVLVLRRRRWWGVQVVPRWCVKIRAKMWLNVRNLLLTRAPPLCPHCCDHRVVA